MDSNCIRGGVDCILGKISLLKEWSGIGTGCRESGGVTIPGGVEKTCSCCTSGHGIAGMVALMILAVFSNCNFSMILCFYEDSDLSAVGEFPA